MEIHENRLKVVKNGQNHPGRAEYVELGPKIIKKWWKMSKNEPRMGPKWGKKSGKNDQNGPHSKWSKWLKMVKNGRKWPEMVKMT